MNVINWLGLASHFTFRKHTAKIWGLAGSVMYITDKAAWGSAQSESHPARLRGLGRLRGAGLCFPRTT